MEAELIARSIHARTPPCTGPLVPIDCASLAGEPHTSIGDFIEQAARGTLFLRGIAGLDPVRQEELAQELFRRAGTIPRGRVSEPRVLVSSDIDLTTLVRESRFHEELFYRLNVLTVSIPALRERLADLPELSRRALHATGSALAKHPGLAPETLDFLRKHTWPGNLFELEIVLAQAVLRCTGDVIRPADVAPGLAPAATSDARSLREMEEVVIRRALHDERGNRSRAARSLGIHRATLYNKLRQYGIV